MPDALQLHADQVAYWNGPGGDRWIASQARRDLMLASFATVALSRADAQPGETVVDIGCGCGETSAELAKGVGLGGRVLAVDVSAPILAAARDRLAPFANATAVVADAATYPFETAAVDLLFSRFGVMFFGDPAAAFANLRRALKPSGRLVFACWRTQAENLWMTAPLKALFQHVPRPPSPDPEEPGPFSFADQARVTRILTQAGFAAPTFESIDMTIDVAAGNGVDGAVGTAMEFGPASRILADQPADVKQAVEESLREYFTPLERDGVIALPAAIWIVRSTLAAG